MSPGYKWMICLLVGQLAGLLFSCSATVLEQEAEAAELVCWTYTRPPRCVPFRHPGYSCCDDQQNCHTWLTPTAPVCDQMAENVFVCCGEDESP